MLIIPAVDIKNGKCVRLFQGKASEETIYADNPFDYALKWEEAGAEYLHVIDLDGAFGGETTNLELISSIVNKTNNIKIEVGGGIRTLEAVNTYLNLGVDRVILGTKALEETFLKEILTRFQDKIVIGIDAQNGFVVTEGWVTKTKIKGVDFVKKASGLGAKRIIYTDITYDGTLKGPNLKGIAEVLNSAAIPVIASGGVSGIEDLQSLKNLKAENLEGVIIGKALYTGAVNLKEAIDLFTG